MSEPDNIVPLSAFPTGISFLPVKIEGLLVCSDVVCVNWDKQYIIPSQEPIPQEAYDESFWRGEKSPWWSEFGVSEDGKRKTEGEAPARIISAFNPSSILDSGAGPGWLAKFLSEFGSVSTVVGLDYSKQALKISPIKEKMVLGSVTEMPFADKSFDLVISREVFEHLTVEQAQSAFDEILRVSKKWIYMTIWMNFDPEAKDDVVLDDLAIDPTHITFCTRNWWNNFFKKYIDDGIIKEDKEKEEFLDWRGKGRVYVFELIRKGESI